MLATSVDADSIYAVPTEVEDAKALVTRLCAALGDCKEKERQTLVERLGQTKAFAFVRRQVSPDQARRVAALNLDAIGFFKETRRFYPNKELAAHLLGYVGVDNNGLGGLEYTYDQQIRGKPGTVLIQTDARRHAKDLVADRRSGAELCDATCGSDDRGRSARRAAHASGNRIRLCLRRRLRASHTRSTDPHAQSRRCIPNTGRNASCGW